MSNPHFFFSHVALICKGLFFLAHLKCAELATYFASLNVRSSFILRCAEKESHFNKH